MCLGAAHAGGKMRPIGAQAVQRHDGGIDQIDALGHHLPQTAMGLRHQRRQHAAEHRRRPPPVGIGQGRALHRNAAQVIKPRRVACQSSDDLTQARGPGQLAIKHRQEMPFRRQAARIVIRAVLVRQRLKPRPGNMLHKVMQNDILMRHGVGPRSCLKRRQTLGHK